MAPRTQTRPPSLADRAAMKPSGSLSDIAGSVKGYLRKKQQRRSLAAELFEVRRGTRA